MYLGSHYRAESNPPFPSEIEYEVVGITEHPDFDLGTYDADISLLELNMTININEDIKPACAPDPSNLYVHTVAEISGWGALDSGNTTTNR